MKSAFSLAVSLAGLAVIACSLPASAQYSSEFSPAKLTAQGKTSLPIAGSGTVIVQVQVNADGTHKAIKVIKSSNSGAVVLRLHLEVQRQVGGTIERSRFGRFR